MEVATMGKPWIWVSSRQGMLSSQSWLCRQWGWSQVPSATKLLLDWLSAVSYANELTNPSRGVRDLLSVIRLLADAGVSWGADCSAQLVVRVLGLDLLDKELLHLLVALGDELALAWPG